MSLQGQRFGFKAFTACHCRVLVGFEGLNSMSLQAFSLTFCSSLAHSFVWMGSVEQYLCTALLQRGQLESQLRKEGHGVDALPCKF
jgi:hypothetical protein